MTKRKSRSKAQKKAAEETPVEEKPQEEEEPQQEEPEQVEEPEKEKEPEAEEKEPEQEDKEPEQEKEPEKEKPEEEEPEEEEEEQEEEEQEEESKEEEDKEESTAATKSDIEFVSGSEAEGEEQEKEQKKKRKRAHVSAGVSTNSMVLEALEEATSHKGMSVNAIRQYVIQQYDVNPAMLKTLLRNALTKLLAKELIVRPKGQPEQKSALLGHYRLAAKPKGEAGEARAPPTRALRNNNVGATKKKANKRRRKGW